MSAKKEKSELMAWLREQSKPENYILTDDEYYAVYEYIDGGKDGFPEPLKEGLLKLLNGEMYRRM